MTSIFQTSNTSVVLTIPYNVQHNISVSASNCAENSTTGTISVLVGKHISNSLGSLVNKYIHHALPYVHNYTIQISVINPELELV